METKPNVQKGWTEKETDRQISILIMKGMYRDRTLLRIWKLQGWNITQDLEITGTEQMIGKLRGRTITHDLEITGMESCQISKVNCQFQTNWWLQTH